MRDTPLGELTALRTQIDQIDEELIQLLSRRFAVTAQVGALKRHHALEAIDTDREARQRLRHDETARQHGLEPAFVQRVFRTIIDQVVTQHRKPD